VAGQENCLSHSSLDPTQLSKDNGRESNGSLPDIHQSDAKMHVYETMSKQNMQGAIASIQKDL
jgi:hypothetical protein